MIFFKIQRNKFLILLFFLIIFLENGKTKNILNLNSTQYLESI